MKTIKLSDSVSIPVLEYASQGNAVLGIRDSGKTYSATCLAEHLIDANVPIIAFDPIGIWRNLKVPGPGGKGFGVVVAGGMAGDFPLTPRSAPEIVRAAMRENISVVLDLYTMQMSKADWRTIVERALEVLLYENKSLRHIYIEEAAEFCPQRVGPESGRVYAAVEKLARMGGNASLGYTLINQRAEEVNKAVLELCDCLFLHRQKGRNSLTALGKWLDYADAADSRQIVQSLPLLKQGECWVWSQGTSAPRKVQMPKKQSLHPDRRNPVAVTANKAVDVGAFVERLKASLPKDEPKVATVAKPAKAEIVEKVVEVPIISDEDRTKIHLLLAQMREARDVLVQLMENVDRVSGGAKSVMSNTSTVANRPDILRRAQRAAVTHMFKNLKAEAGESIPDGLRRMMIALAQRPSGLSAKQLGVRAGLSSNSGTFGTYLGRARSNDWIFGERDLLLITEAGIEALGDYTPLPTGEALLRYWLGELPDGAQRMLDRLAAAHPDPMTAEDLGAESEISHTSGTFGTYLGKLRALELVTGERNALRAADELFD